MQVNSQNSLEYKQLQAEASSLFIIVAEVKYSIITALVIATLCVT